MNQALEPAILREHRAEIIDCIRNAVLPASTLPAKMIAYHLGLTDHEGRPQTASLGKLVRPSLCLWAVAACGGDVAAALPVAAGIEFLHNFTLIHDDIQDGDRVRRDRETVWVVWGMGQGINAGDALYALAYRLLTYDSAHSERMLRVVRRVTTAVLEVVGGQCRDLQLEGDASVSIRDYLGLAFGKTGALLGASLEAGAIAAGAPQGVARRFRRAGRLFGVALQLRDDWLGIWGDPKLTGKSIQTDLARSKATYPVVHAYRVLDEARRSRLRSSFMTDEVNPGALVRELLLSAGSDEATRALAERYAAKAVATIAGCGVAGSLLGDFEEMARYIAHRVR